MLFAQHYDQVASYARQRVIDSSTADDIAQATFLEAWNCRARYDATRGHARAWLFGIANHLLARHFRTERRRLRAYARLATQAVDESDPSQQAIRRLDAQALRAQIASALAALPRGDYEVLTLYCWADLSYEEIAIALEIPSGTVRSRLHRARRRVRAELDATNLGASDG